MTKDDVLRMFVGNGFKIIAVEPKPNYHLFSVERAELFGAPIQYAVAVAADKFDEADVGALGKLGERGGGNTVLVGEFAGYCKLPLLSHEQFSDRLGGSVLSLLPLNPEYGDRLKLLGKNELPSGLHGDPSDLFEEYVQAGFQYLFGARVIRYGQERRFERVADGIVLGDAVPLLLYDAKAYSGGYVVTAESIRQFASYVNDLHRRYASRLGQAFSFLVVSASFTNGQASMKNKSQELRAEASGVGLCFVTADALSTIVSKAVSVPLLRRSVDWRRLLSEEQLTVRSFENALAARKKDGV